MILRLLWTAWIAAVVIGSLLPPSSAAIDLLSKTGLSDKFDHLFAYALLAFLPALHEDRDLVVSLALFACALGTALEFLQPRFGRSYELADMAADLAGILIGLAAAFLLRLWVLRSRTARP